MSTYTILITGASSGIGAELARQHAAPSVHLILTGRNLDRLHPVADEARAAGARVTLHAIDVTDRAAMAAWLSAQDAQSPIDLVYANAGIADGLRRSAYEPETVSRALFETNLYGVLNTVYPLLPSMQARGGGQIALISSLAGYGPLASTPGYAASKAAVRVWGESMRFGLARLGIGLTVVCPGFIKTPMTDGNPFPMPFLLDLPQAATRIRLGVAANRRRVVFPWPLAALAWFFHLLPPAWTSPTLARALPKMSDAAQERPESADAKRTR